MSGEDFIVLENEEYCIGNELDFMEIGLDCMRNRFDGNESCKMYFINVFYKLAKYVHGAVLIECIS